MYVIVITPLPGHYPVYTRNDIHNPEGVAWGINEYHWVCIDNAHGRGVITGLYNGSHTSHMQITMVTICVRNVFMVISDVIIPTS